MTEGNFGNRWQRKVAPCLDDAAACSLMIELDRALRRGAGEDSHKQYMDTVALKALVTGFQKEVDHAAPIVATETSDSEEAWVIKTITWTETL